MNSTDERLDMGIVTRDCFAELAMTQTFFAALLRRKRHCEEV